MPEPLAAGRSHERTWKVTAELSAARFGNTGVEVLATPALVGLVEATCVLAVKDALAPGEATVGTHVDLRHLAATPIGDTVRVRAELVEVEGRRLRFRFEAFDSHNRVAEGTHERFVVDLERFLARTRAQRASSANP